VIHDVLKHSLILEFRGRYPGLFAPTTTIVIEVAENGSLASHLPSASGTEMCQLQGKLLAHKPAFSKDLRQVAVAKRLVVDNERSTIPAFVLLTVQRLIRKCWK
jgi:hypothetical protein